MGMPVLMPGPTINGVIRKYFCAKSSTVRTIEGTTLETMIPATADRRTSCAANRLCSRTPYSSAVRSGSVTKRQW